MNDVADVRYKNYDWERPFDPREYRSPKAITMLYENWLQADIELSIARKELELLKVRLGELDKSHAVLISEKEASHRRKWTPFSLQVVAAICAGIGVNILTGHDNVLYGGLFVGTSIILEVIAFLMVRQEL